ncbi:MAG: hypothetical protein HY900_23665 [Deltaproteobacteria bacterium]|nr:hypothetical protein [Deltaproteobacteria bacterium]
MAWRLYGSGIDELKRCIRNLHAEEARFHCLNGHKRCFYNDSCDNCLAPVHMGSSPLEREKVSGPA